MNIFETYETISGSTELSTEGVEYLYKKPAPKDGSGKDGRENRN